MPAGLVTIQRASTQFIAAEKKKVPASSRVPVRRRISKATVVPRSASARSMRSTSNSAGLKTKMRMSGQRVQFEPSTASPISSGTAASLTASQKGSTLSSPMPPVSSVLMTPSTATPLTLRRRRPSRTPQKSGKASASTRAPAGPSRSGLLSCISTIAGTRIVTKISNSGLPWAGRVVMGVRSCAGVWAQCTAQEPGPSGWPQLPQGPIADIGAASAGEPWVAKTDSSFSRSVEWQLGHAATVVERTRVSNCWPQSWQAYSKIGMAVSGAGSQEDLDCRASARARLFACNRGRAIGVYLNNRSPVRRIAYKMGHSAIVRSSFGVPRPPAAAAPNAAAQHPAAGLLRWLAGPPAAHALAG